MEFRVPEPRVEPTPRRVRVRAGGMWVADSTRALLLAWYGPGMLPTYCFAPDDVRADLFQPSEGDPRGLVVEHDVRVGSAVFPRAAHLFRDPPEPLAGLDGHWSFAWDGQVSWFEEALEVHVHARDPSKRVDVLPSERHARVEVDGEVIAESRRPHALFETSLPTRWYLPVEDVGWEKLEPSGTVTQCPYKGTARYWSARVGGEVHADVAWSYPDPVVECPRIEGLVAFFNEKVDLTIDGVPEARPVTPWSS